MHKSQSFTHEMHNVRITAAPLFLAEQSVVQKNMFFWAYNIHIENLGLTPLKLLTRHWKVIDSNGDIQEINGVGVVGQQPLIPANSGFQYSSGTFLNAPSGVMMGKYSMLDINQAYEFLVEVPVFSLDSPFETHKPS